MRPTMPPWSLHRRWFVGVVIVVSLFQVASARAQGEPNDTDAARFLAAREKVIAGFIRRYERSVVSVARVRKRRPARVITAFDRQRTLDPLSQRKTKSPKDPGFVPNEFATGVVVDSAGLVLINYHVLAEDSEYFVWVGGRSFDTNAKATAYRAKVKAADPRSDLAVLEIVEQDKPEDLVPIRFGDAKTLQKGHFVVALGNPYAIARDGEVRATSGMISALGRKAAAVPAESHPRLSRPTLHHYGTLIQTDVQLNVGTSGSALLDLRGRMVGLTTCVAPAAGDRTSATYAIPVDSVFTRVVRCLKKGREVEYGLLGVVPKDLLPFDRQRGQRGCRIHSVQGGSPARRAGVHPGDIVTAVNGQLIDGEEGLMLQVGRLGVEAQVRLDILRAGRKLQKRATLTKYPVVGKQIFTPEPAWRGMRVDYSSVRKLGPFTHPYGPGLYDGCVWVREVAQDSPAWQCGLRPGMFITHVENQRVKTPKDFRTAVADKRQTVKLRLGRLRGGEEPVRSVKPEAG